jgi:hypothetical protein
LTWRKDSTRPGPLVFKFCFTPDFVSSQSRAFSFSFCAELFSFSLPAEQAAERQPKEKIFSKKFFNVGVVGAKRTIFRLLLHRKTLI